MNSVDIGLICFFMLGVFYGYRRGFVGQAMGLLGLLISFAIAYSLSQDTAVFLQGQFPLPKESPNPFIQAILGMVSIQHLLYTVAAFVLLFFLSRFLWKLLGKFLDVFASLPVISIFNRWLGALFGSLQVLAVLIILINLMAAMPANQWKETVFQSHISKYLLQISPFLSEQMRFIPQKNIDVPKDPYRAL